MSIRCKDQENDNIEDIITTTSPFCRNTMNRNCLELHEGNSQSQHHTHTCMAVEQEQSLSNASIPNTIQVPRRDMKQHPVIQDSHQYHQYQQREYPVESSMEALLLQRLSQEEKDILLQKLLHDRRRREEISMTTVEQIQRRREMDMLNTQSGILVSFKEEKTPSVDEDKTPSVDEDTLALQLGMKQSIDEWQEYQRKQNQASAIDDALLEKIKAKSLNYESNIHEDEEQVLEEAKKRSLIYCESEEESSLIELVKSASLKPPSIEHIEERLIEEAKQASLACNERQMTAETVSCSESIEDLDRKMPAREL